METASVLSNYQKKHQTYSKQSKALNQVNRLITVIRTLTILFLIYTAYQCYLHPGSAYLITGLILLLVLVIIILYYHSKKKQQLIYTEALTEVNQTEIDHLLEGKLKHKNGENFIDPSHEYSFDLDLFGQQSLFHFINRTESYPGQLELAKAFLHPKKGKEIIDAQYSIKELAEKIDWRQQFAAKVIVQPDSEQQYQQLIQWSQQPKHALPKAILFLAYLLPVLLITSYCIYLITAQGQYESISGYLFLINLGLFSTQLGRIKREMPTAEKIHPIIQQYSELFKHIEQQSFTANQLVVLQNELGMDGKKISAIIRQFSSLLSRMDSLQNGLGAMIFNGIGLYHLHTLNALIAWKKKHGPKMEKWLQILGEFEALNALANFSYNHPSYVYPSIHEENKIEFEQLGHPLIHESKRVCSDVSFNEKKFIIITGSNMSGKSTFLRSLGVNMILAEMGAPVCAVRAQLCPLAVVASMRTSDSLTDSESYFFAEVKRLKYIKDKLQTQTCFILLDEILKGTNSDDKRQGTIAFIKKIINLKAVGAIATHDLEVCHTTDEYPHYLVNQCFEVEILQNELHFDYKLRNGICKNKSASFLMKKMDII